jgi:hypothetical protein
MCFEDSFSPDSNENPEVNIFLRAKTKKKLCALKKQVL